jgi:hypothetical protein
MKNLLKYVMLMLVVALVGSTAAYASGPLVPEVDPAMAISAFALLAGAVTVLRARRSR